MEHSKSLIDKYISTQLERFILSIPDSLSELEMINFEQEEALFYTFKDKIRTIKNEIITNSVFEDIDS